MAKKSVLGAKMGDREGRDNTLTHLLSLFLLISPYSFLFSLFFLSPFYPFSPFFLFVYYPFVFPSVEGVFSSLKKESD